MTHIRNGMGTVRPYVYGPPSMLDFVRETFGAEVVERMGGEVGLRLGDSMLALTLGDFPEGNASIYVYVEDSDAVYERALRAGATSVAEPTDKPYQERQAAVRDASGTTWWISTYVGDA
jgi:PhnB protein